MQAASQAVGATGGGLCTACCSRDHQAQQPAQHRPCAAIFSRMSAVPMCHLRKLERSLQQDSNCQQERTRTGAEGDHGQDVCLPHVRLEVLIEHNNGAVADVVVRGHPPQLCRQRRIAQAAVTMTSGYAAATAFSRSNQRCTKQAPVLLASNRSTEHTPLVCRARARALPVTYTLPPPSNCA